MIHLLVAGDDLDRDAVEIEGDDYRHLFRARRLVVGDRVRLVDGRGGRPLVDRRRCGGRAGSA